jgi:NAD(P)-dependent dehydrogenase (short-subunit alcohol dehydrogenase family)
MPEQPGYCASKGGVFQLTRQVAIDYAADNIRCNSVGPGSVDAEFVRVYIEGQSDPGEAEARLVGGHPMQRMATPKEIAETVSFLLSDRSSFVTGANLQVDGGYSAK